MAPAVNEALPAAASLAGDRSAGPGAPLPPLAGAAPEGTEGPEPPPRRSAPPRARPRPEPPRARVASRPAAGPDPARARVRPSAPRRSPRRPRAREEPGGAAPRRGRLPAAAHAAAPPPSGPPRAAAGGGGGALLPAAPRCAWRSPRGGPVAGRPRGRGRRRPGAAAPPRAAPNGSRRGAAEPRRGAPSGGSPAERSGAPPGRPLGWRRGLRRQRSARRRPARRGGYRSGAEPRPGGPRGSVRSTAAPASPAAARRPGDRGPEAFPCTCSAQLVTPSGLERPGEARPRRSRLGRGPPRGSPGARSASGLSARLHSDPPGTSGRLPRPSPHRQPQAGWRDSNPRPRRAEPPRPRGDAAPRGCTGWLTPPPRRASTGIPSPVPPRCASGGRELQAEELRARRAEAVLGNVSFGRLGGFLSPHPPLLLIPQGPRTAAQRCSCRSPAPVGATDEGNPPPGLGASRRTAVFPRRRRPQPQGTPRAPEEGSEAVRQCSALLGQPRRCLAEAGRVWEKKRTRWTGGTRRDGAGPGDGGLVETGAPRRGGRRGRAMPAAPRRAAPSRPRGHGDAPAPQLATKAVRRGFCCPPPPGTEH